MAQEITRITSRPPEPSYQDDVQLADYLIVGWRYRWLILLLTVAGGMLGLIGSRTRPVLYEATAVVSLVPRPAGQPGATTAADVQALFRSQALATQALAALGLDKPPYSISANALPADWVTVETVPNTNTLRVRVALDQPERAASVANELVRQAADANIRATQSMRKTALEKLRADLQKAKARLDDVEAQLIQLQAASRLALTSKEIEELATERASLKNVAIDIGAQQAKVAAIEQELKQQQPANALVERLQYELAFQRSELAALIERQWQLTELTRRQLPERQLAALYAREAQLDRVLAEHSTAQGAYISLAEQNRKEETAADATPQLQIVDPAIAPLSPVSPGTVRLVMIGLVIGMFVAIVVALALNYFKALGAYVREI